MRLSENITQVFLSEQGDLTVRDILNRSEHRGFGFLFVILSLPVALPFTPPGLSTPFAALIGLLACQMMARREHPWFPDWVMRRRVKSGDNRFMRAMRKWAEFFERFLRPRAQWLYRGHVFRWILGPIILLAAAAMSLPFPGTNSIPAIAICLIGLGLIEEDGAFGLFGALIGLAGLALATTVVVLIILYGPQGIEMIKSWLGR